MTLSPYTAPFLAIVPLPNVRQRPTDGAALLRSPGGNDHDTLGENYGQMRVDHNFSDADTLFARYTIDNAFQNQTQDDYSYFRYLVPARNQWITLAENHIFSPTVLNTVRFSFSRTNSSINLANVGLPGMVWVPASCRVFPPA